MLSQGYTARMLTALLMFTSFMIGCFQGPSSARAQELELASLFPQFDQGGEFPPEVGRIGFRTLPEYASTFADPGEAASLLTAWGWQDHAYQNVTNRWFGGSGVRAPYLNLSLTRFADETGAAAALPYIVQDHVTTWGHREVPLDSPLGDEAHALVADGISGLDHTLYVRDGPLIIRVSALIYYNAHIGEPTEIVADIIAKHYASLEAQSQTRSILPDLLATLPPGLPSCLALVDEGEFDFAQVVRRFPMFPDADAQLRTLGWEAGAFRQFSCDDPPARGLNWVDLSVHEFASRDGAIAAVPYFADARTTGTQLSTTSEMPIGDASTAIAGPSELGHEVTLYASIGQRLLRVTAIAHGGCAQELSEGSDTLPTSTNGEEGMRRLTTACGRASDGR